MGRNICKNVSKNLSAKYRQKIFDNCKQSATDALKTASKRAIQKTADSDGDLIGNKIADKVTNVSRSSPQNSSQTVESETGNTRFDRKIPKERYTYTCIYINIRELSNIQVDDVHVFDVVMPIYDLIEYSGIYSRTSRRLSQYYRDEPASDANDAITDFPANNSFLIIAF